MRKRIKKKEAYQDRWERRLIVFVVVSSRLDGSPFVMHRMLQRGGSTVDTVFSFFLLGNRRFRLHVLERSIYAFGRVSKRVIWRECRGQSCVSFATYFCIWNIDSDKISKSYRFSFNTTVSRRYKTLRERLIFLTIREYLRCAVASNEFCSFPF